MAVKQIYSVVNSLMAQSTGNTDIAVVDESGIISLGEDVLSSSVNTEQFLNTLVERIGKTIISFRRYRSMFSGLMLSDMEYGNIVQKIKIDMPQAQADQSYGLTDGVSVDMYTVSKPVVTQHLFTTETPWQVKITVQRVHLKERFTSSSNLESFIAGIFGEVQNQIELGLENLGRNCINNYMGEVLTNGTHRAINLLDMYNTETNHALTTTTAKYNADFLRFVVGKIKLYSKRMQAMSTIYNDKSTTRHTPLEMQRLYVLADYETKLETVVEYAAFNKDYVSLNGFVEVPYWQSIDSPERINVKIASDGTTVSQDNIIACLFDRDALGIYKADEWISTTPFNSAGGYANTFWHIRDIYVNDMSENFVLFYMADA